MNRTTAYALGPELMWALVFGITAFLVARNQPPTEAGNRQLEAIGWFLPLVGVALSFVPLAWAPGNQWWCLLRIVVAGLIALFFVVGHLCGGIDYHDSRNSGVGTAYMLFIGLGVMALLGGAALSALFLFTRWPFLPFLKWASIIAVLCAALWGVICWLASMRKSGAP